MTNLPNSAADRAASAPTPDDVPPAGDPELAALVRRDLPPITEPGVEAVPVVPLVASVTGGKPPARPRRSRQTDAGPGPPSRRC